MKCNLRQVCRAKKISLYKLAQLSYINAQTIYHWANNRNLPSSEYVDYLCQLLNITVSDLLTAEKISDNRFNQIRRDLCTRANEQYLEKFKGKSKILLDELGIEDLEDSLDDNNR